MTSGNEKRIAAVIPALNEAATIQSVIAGVRQYATAIVVDDGSTDETAKIARDSGAIVESHVTNRGYEAALRTGLERACELGFQCAITIDADGQHEPAIIESFHNKISDGYDLVIGYRDRMQRFGEAVFSIVGRVIWGIKDPMCGVKAYSAHCLQNVISISEFDSIGTKYAVEAVRKGYKFAQLPVLTHRRIDAPRFGSGLRVNIRILKALKTLVLLRSSS